MRIRRGGMDRLIRRVIAGAVIIMLMFVCGRYISRAAGRFTKNDFRHFWEAGGQWMVETLWNRANPAGNPVSSGIRSDPGEGVRGESPDPDPAYRKYQAVKEFYEEHQYLAWYGDEETGQLVPDGQMALSTQGQAWYGSGTNGENGSWGSAGTEGAAAGGNGGAWGGGNAGGSGGFWGGGNAGESGGAWGGENAGGNGGAWGGENAGGSWDTWGSGNAGGEGNSGGTGGAGQSQENGGYAAGENGQPIMQTVETLTGNVIRPITGTTYVLEQLMDYDFLMKHFYSVHTSTTAGRDLMNAKRLLDVDTSMKGDNSKPQILIYHTHSQEAYANSGPGQNVAGVGEYLAKLLEAKGYNVYHDTSVYDLRNGQLDRSKAYNYALDGVAGILQKHPSIEVVLDIHRDGVGENLRLMTQVDGKDTAQIMFFNGLSQTPEGPIEYLPNPYREDNLAFSLKMQLNAAACYPGFTRKIYLKGLRYNEHLRPKSSLIEVGAQTNTYEEALNAMEPLSELLDMVLQGNKKNDMIQ